MRRIGPMGALMDEYERALKEFLEVISPLDNEIFIRIIDPDTENEDCRSFQTIINHVLLAGYGYSNYIRKVFLNEVNSDPKELSEIEICENQLLIMFDYMLETLKDIMKMPENEFGKHIIPVRWNQAYDLEQLLEHAIVHILRHRRQLENFWVLAKN